MSQVVFESHFTDFKEANEEKLKRALTLCGVIAEGYSLRLAQEQDIHDTGRLWSSINSKVEGHTMSLRDGVTYGIYSEMGTGIENVAGGTPKERWFYCDDLGQWHVAHPMPARPFIAPAIANHLEHYHRIIESELAK